MKFKSTLLLASMVAAGALVTAPAFAARTASMNAAADSQVAQMEAIMNANQSSVKPTTSDFAKDWFQKIQISGLANLDATYASRGYSGTNKVIGNNSSSEFSLNNVNVYLDAPINDWTALHTSFVYQQNRADSTAIPRINNSSSRDFNIDEAYVAFRNFNVSPVYATLGKQYIDFGTYKHYPMFDSLTQLMTETNATAATVGVVTSQGLHGSVYAFNGPKDGKQSPTRTNVRDYGLRLGYEGSQSNVNYGINFGYIRNIGASTYINNHLRVSGQTDSNVGAWNVNLHAATGPFYGSANYVVSQRFKAAGSDAGDLSYNGRGAKPWAYNLRVGYRFDTMGHNSNVELGFGQTGEASGSNDTNISTRNTNGLYLPKTRWVAMYNVNILKNTDLGVGLLNDKDYSKSKGGSGRTTTAGTVRLSVQFA